MRYFMKNFSMKEQSKRHWKILFASMKLHNRQINLYYFEFDDEEGYYDINGKSIVKSLMKTPINGARFHHHLE